MKKKVLSRNDLGEENNRGYSIGSGVKFRFVNVELVINLDFKIL